MTRPATPTRPGFGSVHIGEILPVRELARRFGLGRRTVTKLKAMGLKTIRIGRIDFVRGVDVVDLFDGLAEGGGQ